MRNVLRWLMTISFLPLLLVGAVAFVVYEATYTGWAVAKRFVNDLFDEDLDWA
jgi:hypothetical protein